MQCPECRQHELEAGQQRCWWCRPTTVSDDDAAPLLAEPTWEPRSGALLRGTWKLLSRLGAGGMGFVWLAEEASLGRTVAIKFLSQTLCRQELAVKRFWREARLAALVEHPHIVPIYAVGEEGGWPYLVMKHLSGQTLGELTAELGALPLAEAQPLLKKLAGGVDALHARGVVHRDLKPANVIVTGPEQHPWLVDFGISSALSASTLTVAKGVMGTAHYVAPEVISGGSQAARAAADQYSFAVLAYQVLTGKLPFAAENTLMELQVKLKAELTAPSTLVPGLGANVDVAFVRALKPRPEDRFESVSAFADALGSSGAVPSVVPKRSKALPLLLGAASVVALGLVAWRATETDEPKTAPVRVAAEPPAPPLETPDASVVELEVQDFQLETKRPPRAAPAAPPKKGVVDVSVIVSADGQPSWASMLVDGAPAGSAPGVVKLTPGKHRLRFERQGFRPIERNLTVGAGANPVVEVKLKR